MRLATRALTVCFVIAIALATTACSITLISAYDQQTDEAVTEVQKGIERLLSDIERTAGSAEGDHANYVSRYEEIRVDLRALQVRADSRPKNDIQVRQLESISEQLALVEAAHRQGLTAPEVEPFRQGFDQSFRSILTLELAKKRGEGS